MQPVNVPVSVPVNAMQPGEVIAIAIIAVVLIAVAVVLLWVLPIMLGIRCARRKHYAPQWMWFGIHPLGGWIAFLVLASLPARLVCSNCNAYVASQFCLCPYCHAPLTGSPNASSH